MRRNGFPIILTLVLSSQLGGQGRARMPEIRVGQQWRYTTRAGEDSSTLIILRVEPDSTLGTIVHIAVHGVRIKNARHPAGFNTELPHIPISKAALERSLTTLVANSVPVPDYHDGYEEWRRAKGGVWSLTVAEIIGHVEQALAGH